MNATRQSLEEHLGAQQVLRGSDQARGTALVIRCIAAVASAIAGGGTGAMLGGPYLYEKGLNDTQRAFYACLAGRGYTVK